MLKFHFCPIDSQVLPSHNDQNDAGEIELSRIWKKVGSTRMTIYVICFKHGEFLMGVYVYILFLFSMMEHNNNLAGLVA